MSENSAPRLLTVEEAAQYLRLPRSNLDKMRCLGGSPTYMKVGHRVLYSQSDLDAWLASKRRTSTSDTGLAA